MAVDVVYFSNYSGNTKRFVDKLGVETTRIPISWDPAHPIKMESPYVLIVPTYGGGSENSAIPKQVKKFLNIPQNRVNLAGIVGMGNTNFGEHYCKAAMLISDKTGKPVIAKVEIFGTNEDVNNVKERLALFQ